MRSRFINPGLFYIILGILGLSEGYNITVKTAINYGPGQYLAVVSGLILLVGLVYYVGEVRNSGKTTVAHLVDAAETQDREESEEELPDGVVRVLNLHFQLGRRRFAVGTVILTFILFTTYAFLVKPIGYLASTILFVASCMLLFGERTWWKIALFASATGGIFWYVFIHFAHIPV